MQNIDWGSLPFGYYPTNYNIRCYYRNGEWGELEYSSETTINIHMAATCLHYGQEAFEGLKAHRGADGKVRIFRLDHFGESWGIKKGIIMGRPDDDETWAALDDVLDHVFRFESGVGLRLSMSFMDEGGHFTMEVRQRCAARQSKRLFCIKGMPGQDRPYTGPPKKQKIMIRNVAVGTVWQYQIGVDSGKEIIMDNLKAQAPGPKYCHFPRRDDYGGTFFKGLLSEVKVYDPNKKQPWVWKKIPGHERNEALDCRNYALAAFKSLSANLDEIDRRLKAAKKNPAAASSAPPSAPAQKKRRKKGRGLKEQYDEW